MVISDFETPGRNVVPPRPVDVLAPANRRSFPRPDRLRAVYSSRNSMTFLPGMRACKLPHHKNKAFRLIFRQTRGNFLQSAVTR